MILLKKLIAGSNYRVNRFRSEKDVSIHLLDLAYLIPAFIHWVLNKLGRAPNVPIVNFSALRIFKLLSRRQPAVLEFGSGRSTIWWLKNGCEVTSVENHEGWYKEVSLKTSKYLPLCKYIFAENVKDYSEAGGDNKFDLIIVDGSWRRECMENALKHNLKENGIVYLDDSDKCSSFFLEGTENNNVRGADSLLQEWAYKNDYFIMRVNNFSPTHLFVKEGTFAIPKTDNNADLLRAYLY
jgi:hypothetical protein